MEPGWTIEILGASELGAHGTYHPNDWGVRNRAGRVAITITITIAATTITTITITIITMMSGSSSGNARPSTPCFTKLIPTYPP